ncbi:MAG: hypothetical protein AB7H97_01910 [Pseudobdellovibrionaceae bacterium]
MRNLFLAVAVLLSSLALAQKENGKHIDVDIIKVRDELLDCDCTIPANLGRICIAKTKWRIPENVQMQTLPPLTRFEAQITGPESTLFELSTTAYYKQCIYDETPQIFTQPSIQNLFVGKKYFSAIGVKGAKPLMMVAFGEGPFMKEEGKFTDEKFFENQNSQYEYHTKEYPGTVVYQGPLYKALPDSRLRMILDGEGDYIKTAKVWLIFESLEGKRISFGEYAVKMRFYKKKEIRITKQNMWDMRALGVEIIPN